MLILTSFVHGQTPASVQSAARPFNLDIVGQVQVGGSDAKSADFIANSLPGLAAVANQNLSEQQTAQSLSAMALDPNALVLANDATVRAYFISEGAGYHNTLGFKTEGSSSLGTNPQLIFPDASSYQGLGGNGNNRTSWEPLVAGDYVELGEFSAGDSLDFFVIANGVNGGTNVWSTDDSTNVDGIVHTVSLAPNGSAYLVIGFEDLYGGGDNDYNDLIFAVEIGEANVKSLAGPEPGLAFGSLCAFSLLLGMRRQR